MKRRDFVKNISIGSLILGVSFDTLLTSCKSISETDSSFHQLVKDLLADWCDGMLEQQVIQPDNLAIHGSLDCPSCDHIHGRCMDAVYPFLYMADTTGEQKYIDAALLVMEWAENNVSHANGSWSVIPNPKSWKGITVFGAIALAEALHHHGHVLDVETREAWTKRLKEAAEYVYQTFSLSFTNINYGATAIYALNLIGKMVNNQEYINRSREWAQGISSYFTAHNSFLFGEGKPSDKLSTKGLKAIDLGYNVEESLSNLVLYAVEENDQDLLSLLKKSLDTLLEFMLPDGAWDNSWGTRQFKWSYWGSRTCDGSQLTYASMIKYNPAYFTAVVRNTELLKACTAKGLLHGGPGYIDHGVKPCIHHTFEHAKPLASLLNHWDKLITNKEVVELPREKDYGVKYFPEIDTALLAKGPWSGTITAYDAIYYKGENRQATGGALSVLYHRDVGLLLTASMAKYKMAEKNNQQPNPNDDFALTPRIECHSNDDWYTNLYDLSAKIALKENTEKVNCRVSCLLKNEEQRLLEGTASKFNISYKFSNDEVLIEAQTEQEITSNTSLVIPIVTTKDEQFEQVSGNEIKIYKKGKIVVVSSDTPLRLLNKPDKRVFNMVPGVAALPIFAGFPVGTGQYVTLKISVEA